MSEVFIPSTGTHAAVRLFNAEPDATGFGHFFVEVEGGSLQAGLRVHAYQSKGMADLFDELAKNSRWQGKRSWESAEGELQFTCSTNLLGDVRIEVRLRENTADGWRVTATAALNAGELEALARDVRAFVLGLTAVR